jgi:hypothetical protein
MNIFQRIASIFTAQRPPGTGDDRYLTVYLYSNRCREALYARIDRMNELSIAEQQDASGEEGDAPDMPAGAAYFVRKVVHTSGETRCFSQVEVELWLDSRKQVLAHTVVGGRWLEEEEYNRLIDEEIARREAEEQAEDLVDDQNEAK